MGFGFQDVVELKEAATGVVEYTVQNNPDTALVASFQQGSKSGITTQKRIYLVIVVGVIAVIGC